MSLIIYWYIGNKHLIPNIIEKNFNFLTNVFNKNLNYMLYLLKITLCPRLY